MREIKFRVWDKERKTIRMVVGLEAYADWGNFNSPYNDVKVEEREGYYCKEMFELMQYTGLEDDTKWEELNIGEQDSWLRSHPCQKKEDWSGKEIYEGDIINGIFNNEKIVGPVIWFRSGWYVGYINKGINVTSFDAITDKKIIGNIYENSELLETL